MIDIPFVKGWTWDIWEYHMDDKAYWGARLVTDTDNEAEKDQAFLVIQEDSPVAALEGSVALYHEWQAGDRAIRALHWSREDAGRNGGR